LRYVRLQYAHANIFLFRQSGGSVNSESGKYDNSEIRSKSAIFSKILAFQAVNPFYKKRFHGPNSVLLRAILIFFNNWAGIDEISSKF
jgi:hypothetical protein